jgi:mono/diheme cytochrome c family protein
MKHAAVLFAVLAICSSPVLGQPAPSETNGKNVYDKWCTHCHGPVGPGRGATPGTLPGTAALAVKYKGRVPAVLTERTDLTAGFIRLVVRQGLFGMPITRKTEISNAELEDVVAYLTRSRAP